MPPSPPRPDPFELLDRELVLFAGKGGVGKTTCAAAAAVRFAASGPTALLGVDPAGSLTDVLADRPPQGLQVRQLDAEREMEEFRSLYRDEVERVFEALGLDRAARMDRQIIESLWGLAPPGIDEVVAITRLAGETGEGTRTVLDTAPTGHFLRLIAMPELALDWTHRIMRILLKYRALGSLDAPAEPLIRFAKRLRALRDRLADASRTAIVLVTLDAPMIRAETLRLAARLRDLGLPPTAILLNRSSGADPADAGGADPADAADGPAWGAPTLRAPEVAEPVGITPLRTFAAAWERVA